MKSIRQKTTDLRHLKLSPEEGFVLSRIDGTTSVKEIVALTGFDPDRVVTILARLAAEGATEEVGDSAARPELEDALRAFLDADSTPTATEEPPLRPGEPTDADREGGAAHREAGAADDEATDDGAPNDEATDDETTNDGASNDETEAEARSALTYRKTYEATFHPLPREDRSRRALTAMGSELLALCFDPDPQVIHAVLGNPVSGLEHARLVAAHHRTQVGLETLARRVDHLKDSRVQRSLLRNPQVPSTILNRLIAPKPLLETYKLAVDREIPERTRMMTRDLLRKKFMLASADEKASLLFKTEGRGLVLLPNCSLDGHATQIMCSKGGYTILFIQNLARWSATPPALLAHLLKVPVVRRNVGLRKMLLKHPNTPADAKRSAT